MNQLAKRVVDITTGGVEDEEPEQPDPKAVKRGKARADALTQGERSEIARKAAKARWEDE